METIYLVGQISPKYPITYEWRKDIVSYFDQRKDIKIIDPCANQFNNKLLIKNEYAVNKEKVSFGIELLVPKDYTFVQRSDIAIVNMNHYDKSKPMLGSFFELAWYYMAPEKSIIAFADDLNDYQCKHPFVQQAVDVWCNDRKEACYLVDKYFSEV